jgi:hypothetical protein
MRGPAKPVPSCGVYSGFFRDKEIYSDDIFWFGKP